MSCRNNCDSHYDDDDEEKLTKPKI